MYNAIDNIHFHFLYIDRYSFGRNWIFPETNTPYCMLRYIESGTATFHINNHEYSVIKDQIVYIPKGVPLSCYSTSSHFSFTSIRFTTSVFFEGGDLLEEYYHLPQIMEGKGESLYFDEMYNWVKKDSPAKMFFVRGYLELLIASLIAKNNPVETADNAVLPFEEGTEEKLSSKFTPLSEEEKLSKIRDTMEVVVVFPCVPEIAMLVG